MSANVDQRSKGQPNQVSNGANKDVMKDEDPYLLPPQHQIRSWSDQTSDTAYGAPPMSTAGVSESFYQNFYPPNMPYPFMSQGISGSEGPWSNGTDTMFGMGYDYNNVYGGFGFPFNNWDYTNEYWGSSQGVRKDQRGYATDEGYYPPEMIPPDAYGMMNGAAVPPEPQEPIGTVEQGIMGMTITPSNSSTVDSSSRQKIVDINQPPIMSDSFSGGDSSHLMSPTYSQSLHSSVMCGNSQNQAKKTSWAAIASQPARPQQQFRPRTIPRAPVNPNRPHNMDIGTWDDRNNPKAPLPPPIPQPSSQPPQPRQSWVASSARSNNSRQIQPYSTSGPGNDTALTTSNLNSNNSSSGNSVNQGNIDSHSPSYSNYSNTAGGSAGARNSTEDDSATTNGDSYQQTAPIPLNPVLDHLKSSNLYNPKEFNLNSKSARFFIIKSYSEDDIHRSIKYNIWCSTDHGNKRLDSAFREREGKGPVYLIYSVNGSGHFCGIAQMMTPVDYNKTAGVWAQDKWKGQFTVKWVYVKDVPNSQLRHIRLENNENKPVTNSRDTQEVPSEKGKQVLRIVHSYKHTTSIFDDFTHYEKRQEQDATTGQPQRDNRSDSRGDHRGGDHRGGDRDTRGGDRESRGGDRDPRGGDRDNRGGDRDNRGGDRDNRGGDRDNRGGDRDNRGGERDTRGGDRDFRGGDRDTRGGERDTRGGERDFRGGDRDYRGGDRDRGDGPGGRSRDNRRGGQDSGNGGGNGRGGRQN